MRSLERDNGTNKKKLCTNKMTAIKMYAHTEKKARGFIKMRRFLHRKINHKRRKRKTQKKHMQKKKLYAIKQQLLCSGRQKMFMLCICCVLSVVLSLSVSCLGEVRVFHVVGCWLLLAGYILLIQCYCIRVCVCVCWFFYFTLFYIACKKTAPNFRYVIALSA